MPSIRMLITLVLGAAFVSAESKIRKTYITDPIDSSYMCISNNVVWEGDKLKSTNKEAGSIFCEYTGYISFIDKGESDNLREGEKQSIKAFLKIAKELISNEGKYNLNQISQIDYLWLIKSIYERRNLTPKQHIKIMDKIKEISFRLTERIINEKNVLKRDCGAKGSARYWCKTSVLKNKLWEEYQANKVQKLNIENNTRYKDK